MSDAFHNDHGEEAFCVVCDAPGEFNCNACEEDVCGTHVAFLYHDCDSISGEPAAGPSEKASK